MARLYIAFCLLAAFDLSTELGYFVLAIVAVHYFHKGVHTKHH